MKTNYLWRHATHLGLGLFTGLCILGTGPGLRSASAAADSKSKQPVFLDLPGPSAATAKPAVQVAAQDQVPTPAPAASPAAQPANQTGKPPKPKRSTPSRPMTSI